MLRRMMVALLSLVCTFVYAQQADPAQAAVLFNSGKLLQALPLYEKLANDSPNEVLYLDHLVGCLTAAAEQLNDPAERTK